MSEITMQDGRLVRQTVVQDENGTDVVSVEFLSPPSADPSPALDERVASLEEALELLLSGDTGETEVAEDEA